MIKRLRNRFIRIATLSVAAVMLLLTAILNVANYVSTDADLRSTLTLIYENQGTIPLSGSTDTIPEPSGGDVPPPVPPQGKPIGRDGHFTPETPFSTRYFVLRYDADGTLTDADLSKIASVTEDDTAQYLAAALKKARATATAAATASLRPPMWTASTWPSFWTAISSCAPSARC